MLSASWDSAILDLATGDDPQGHGSSEHYWGSHEAHLNHAYDVCRQMTAQHSKSFFMASALLPYDKRRAIRALYAFCRKTDDIVDNGNTLLHPDSAELELENWRKTSLSNHPSHEDPIILAWTDARKRYKVPLRYAHQLVDGMRTDLTQTRYDNFESLTTYCYGAASTVGLMSMHIIGSETEESVRYAVKLGVALQLTNILRDVGEDWQMGRLYLPLDELAAFGLSETDISNGIVTAKWREFMRFQIERTRTIYEEAWPGIEMLSRDGRLSIAAAAVFYRDILTEIEDRDYDNFTQRAFVSKWDKLRVIPRLWLNYR